jgi:hypothetical protein
VLLDARLLLVDRSAERLCDGRFAVRKLHGDVPGELVAAIRQLPEICFDTRREFRFRAIHACDPGIDVC